MDDPSLQPRPAHAAQWLIVIVTALFMTCYFGCDWLICVPQVDRIDEARAGGGRTTAQVLDLSPGDSSGSEGSTRAPTRISYEFQTRTHRYRVDIRSTSEAAESLKAGQKIDVWYDPRDPYRCFTKDEESYWRRKHRISRVATVLAALGVLGGLVGMAWSFLRRRRAP